MLFESIIKALILLLVLLAGACASSRGNVFPLQEGYTSYQQLLPRLQAIAASAPKLVKLNIIGFSGTENLPIYMLEVGTRDAKRNILIVGQHHGDEVLGVEVALAWAEQLAVNAQKDQTILDILAQYCFRIIPTLNPEGYRVVTSGLYQNKRKNNRDTNANGKLDLHSDGVDLNRNYPVFWDEDRVLPVGHPNYKGASPASEPEVLAMMELAQETQLELAIFLHSSPTGDISEKMFLPAIDSLNTVQKLRFQKTKAWADEYAVNLKRDYLSGTYSVSPYPGSRMGTARNYFFHTRECYAFLVEIGGVNKDGISVIHPPLQMKDKIVARNIRALRKLFTANLIRLD